MRAVALLWVVLLAGCGASVATTATATPTPTPSPTPDVPALYSDAVNKQFNYLATDFAAFNASTPGTAGESTAARHISEDYKAFLDSLDRIPFPSNAKDDLSALKKAVVALQIFWSNVSTDSNSYSAVTYNSLNEADNQAELVLGHDVGVSLVIKPFPSPTP